MADKSNPLVSYAERELRIAGWYNESSAYGGLIPDAVLSLIRVFSDEGHSGGSAPIAIGLFSKLAAFKPLTPLTGADDEWMEVGDGYWQNTRCAHVFRQADGRAYDLNGRVFEEPDGCRFTNSDSRVFVEFPYTPTTEIVKVAA